MSRWPTAAVAQLADRQHGVVTREQLRALGASAAAIDNRLRRGHLRLLHRGVYALGHIALRREGVWLAAVLACDEGAVLSHRSAARLWGLAPVPLAAAVDVTVATRVRLPGIAAHRCPLTGADVTRRRGIPVTTVPRTVVDCADVLSLDQLRLMADHGARLDPAAVRRAASRAPNRCGRGAIAALLGDDGSEVRTRSWLERRMRRLALEAGLPRPLVNHRVLGRERDFAWPHRRLVVEVDGHRYHAARGARERDHDRDAEVVLAGWRVLRFTTAQLERAPALVADRLAAALAVEPGPARARR